MTKEEVNARILVGLELYKSTGPNTYTDADFVAHMLDIVKDAGDDHRKVAAEKKLIMEAFIDKVEETRIFQKRFWGGSKDLLGQCKNLEVELDKATINVKEQLKLSTDHFKKGPQPKQGTLL